VKLFDIETNGFYENVETIHVLVIRDTVTRERMVCSHQPFAAHSVEEGLAVLEEADTICGHNVLKYDVPVIQKLYPTWKPKGRVLDTLILAQLLFPELGAVDDRMIKACKLPSKYRGAHKLEAWGYRLGVLKDEYKGDPAIEDPREREERMWESWNQAMEDYCVQDVEATEALYEHLKKFPRSADAIELEHAVRAIVSRQEIRGFSFDLDGAMQLTATLAKERLALETELKARFGWWWGRDKGIVPKADNKRFHYTAGAAVTLVKQVYFNPGSRHHIARVLTKHFGWKPTSFTPTGEPEVNEEGLKTIVHPEAKSLIRFLMVEKRLGQLAEGKEALLKHVRAGKIHGSVNTMGAVTGRMTHSSPNISQTPACYSPYGTEFRALFSAIHGWVLVGCDADALELRDLAHFMALYDGGAYTRTVLEGDKKKGTDMHSVNARALGLDPTKALREVLTGRDVAKTWFYAFIYGAGDEKLGMIITGVRNPKKNRTIGKAARASFMKNLPAMGKLINAVKATAKKNGFLKGLDGRRLHCRSEHAALNTLLQSAGAVAMKKALVILDANLQAAGLKPGVDYEFVANAHDEWQIECRPEVAEQIGGLAVGAIRSAGEHFGFRCPLDGQFKVGRTWADTH
jgi:DNA polymerase-1